MDWRRVLVTGALAAACGKTSASGTSPGAGGQSAVSGPRAFEFVNTTEVTLYVDLRWGVACEQSPSPVGCSFQTSCVGVLCDQLPDDYSDSCNLECEAPTPLALAIHPGESRRVDWDGRVYLFVTDPCVEGFCLQAATEAATYVGVVSAKDSYSCELPPCVEQADGTIPGAVPTGMTVPAEVTFSLPSSDDAVVFVLGTT